MKYQPHLNQDGTLDMAVLLEPNDMKPAEHLLLEVGDTIKIKRGSLLSSVPEGVPIAVTGVYIGPDGERQYLLDWPGKRSTISALMQYGVDKYAQKLVRGPEREEQA